MAPVKPFACSLCPSRFASIQSHNSHISYAHTRTKLYHCTWNGVCPDRYFSVHRQSVRQHIRLRHFNMKKKDNQPGQDTRDPSDFVRVHVYEEGEIRPERPCRPWDPQPLTYGQFPDSKHEYHCQWTRSCSFVTNSQPQFWTHIRQHLKSQLLKCKCQQTKPQK